MIKLKLLIITCFTWTIGFTQQQIKGQVVDLFTRKPLNEVTVKVLSGHQIIAKTDSLGNFQISANGTDSLIFDLRGYSINKVAINSSKNLNITLENLLPIYTIVEEPTYFPGGIAKFHSYATSNINHPTKKKKHGKIFVIFVIDTSGLVMPTKTYIKKAINENLADEIHETYDNEIIRIVNESPAWIPARQRGKKVRQQVVLPISF